MTTYHPTITAAAAHEHVRDLLRAAEISRTVADVPDRHHTPRRRPVWWTHVLTHLTGRRSAAVTG
ncbi:MAG TPA: hypothetical protein VF227_01910 [Actinomycetes bacterium]|jgi:hypothetical protein